MGFHEDIQEIWNHRVNSGYLYRGMSMNDLVDPLDPNRDPFKEIHHQLFALLDVLQELLDAGFRFRLREEHFGNVWWHELQDIVAWTRRDLQDTGIDFTSHRKGAREYADCYYGSQLKENFRYIADHLPDHREGPAIRSVMTEERWTLLSDVSDWISIPPREHRRIVISIGCSSFETICNSLKNG